MRVGVLKQLLLGQKLGSARFLNNSTDSGEHTKQVIWAEIDIQDDMKMCRKKGEKKQWNVWLPQTVSKLGRVADK